MNRLRMSAVGALVVFSLVPTRTYASILLGSGELPAHVTKVLTGIGIAKAVLMLHAVLLLLVPRTLRVEGQLLPAYSGRKPVRTEWMILVALVALGAALRVHDLGSGLWYDEIETLVAYARLPVGHIITTFDSQNQHLLYSITSAVTIGLFGESSWALRLPAAVFGTLSLLAVFWFGRRVTDVRESSLATAVLAFSYHHLWFSQNARGYTALLFCSLVGTGLFIQLLRNERQGWGVPVLYGITMALAIYTHITAVLLVLAHLLVLSVLWWRQRRIAPGAGTPAFWGIVFATTFTLQLYAIVLPQFLATFLTPSHAVDTAWKDPFWLLLETLRGLGAGLPGGWVALGAAMLVAVAGVVSYWREAPALVWLFALPALLTAAVAAGLGHNLWPRFFFFSAGFAVLVAIRGIFGLARVTRLPHPARWAIVASCLLVLGSAATLRRAWLPKQDYLGAARYVRAAQGIGDAVVVVDLTTYPYRQYLQEPWNQVEDVNSLMAIEQSHPHTWVLYTFPIRLAAAYPEIWSRLQTDYTTAAVFPGTVGGGAIVVMVSRPALQRQRSPA